MFRNHLFSSSYSALLFQSVQQRNGPRISRSGALSWTLGEKFGQMVIRRTRERCPGLSPTPPKLWPNSMILARRAEPAASENKVEYSRRGEKMEQKAKTADAVRRFLDSGGLGSGCLKTESGSKPNHPRILIFLPAVRYFFFFTFEVFFLFCFFFKRKNDEKPSCLTTSL